jgi:hypothetical protein
MVIYGGSPGIKRLRSSFSPLVFLRAALVIVKRFTRRHREREYHDVLHGIAGICRSLRAPGGSRLEREIM